MPGQSIENTYEPKDITVRGISELQPCTVAEGYNLVAGTVVGSQSATGQTSAYDADSVSSATTPSAGADNVGDGTISSVVTDDDATLLEDFVLTCTAESAGAGTFSVVGSQSGSLGDATVGVEFSDTDNKVTFTISDGTPDFAEGDTFTFSTTACLAKVANGIIAEDVDATDGEILSSVYTRGTFNTSDLVGFDDQAKLDLGAKTHGDYTII